MKYFFDLDGTLLDHEHAQAEGLKALTLSLPDLTDLSEEVLPKVWRDAEKVHYLRYEREEISYHEQRRERLRDVFPERCKEMSEAELDTLYTHYLKGYRENWRLYSDALPVLQKLSTEPMALITNGYINEQRAKIKHLQIQEFFPSIIISEEVGAFKPDSRAFLAACEKLKVPPSEVSFVGDNFSNDVAGSFAAGMNAVWLNRVADPRPESKVIYREIRSLSELVEG